MASNMPDDVITSFITKMLKPKLRKLRNCSFDEAQTITADEVIRTHATTQAPVVQKLDNAIHRINHYPVDSVVCFVSIYPLDSDLSGG